MTARAASFQPWRNEWNVFRLSVTPRSRVRLRPRELGDAEPLLHVVEGHADRHADRDLGRIDADDVAHDLHTFLQLDPGQHVGQLVTEAARLRAVGDREGVDAAASRARLPLDVGAPAGGAAAARIVLHAAART